MMIIKAQNITSSGPKAFFTTKNLTNNGRDIKEALRSEFNIVKDRIFLPVQRHTDAVHVLGSDSSNIVADAVITDRRDILIGVLTADCVPVLVYDKKKSVSGAVHAGWKGTAARILINTIRSMQEVFNSACEDIYVAIGPSIRQYCYEVGEDVKLQVQEATGEGDYFIRENGKYFIDLTSANVIQALKEGIPQENIWQSDECTFCNPERFYSYRYAQNNPGRQGGFIGMW